MSDIAVQECFQHGRVLDRASVDVGDLVATATAACIQQYCQLAHNKQSSPRWKGDAATTATLPQRFQSLEAGLVSYPQHASLSIGSVRTHVISKPTMTERGQQAPAGNQLLSVTGTAAAKVRGDCSVATALLQGCAGLDASARATHHMVARLQHPERAACCSITFSSRPSVTVMSASHLPGMSMRISAGCAAQQQRDEDIHAGKSLLSMRAGAWQVSALDGTAQATLVGPGIEAGVVTSCRARTRAKLACTLRSCDAMLDPARLTAQLSAQLSALVQSPVGASLRQVAIASTRAVADDTGLSGAPVDAMTQQGRTAVPCRGRTSSKHFGPPPLTWDAAFSLDCQAALKIAGRNASRASCDGVGATAMHAEVSGVHLRACSGDRSALKLESCTEIAAETKQQDVRCNSCNVGDGSPASPTEPPTSQSGAKRLLAQLSRSLSFLCKRRDHATLPALSTQDLFAQMDQWPPQLARAAEQLAHAHSPAADAAHARSQSCQSVIIHDLAGVR
jgi:hypothetical protein